MRGLCVHLLILLLLAPRSGDTEIRRWRVGDQDQPWVLTPVTGRLTWGRGWAVEILTDDDGDGLIDEDPVELIDNDGDALVNEDAVDLQINNDGDAFINEDPLNNLDDDGDGLIDEDPVEAFDVDGDGLIDEDGIDDQVDNDGDGLINEDGLMTDGDDDFDGAWNEDPPNGLDDDGDGMIDEDGPVLTDDPSRGVTTWLSPIRLGGLRNLATMLNARYLNGEFGGLIPGKDLLNPFTIVPTEGIPRTEQADPISGDHFNSGSGGNIARVDYVKAVDGDLATAFGGVTFQHNNDISISGYGWNNMHAGGVGLNLKGYYHIDRIVFRPRPSLPTATFSDYTILYGDPQTVDARREKIIPRRFAADVLTSQSDQVVKDVRFDPPILMGRVDIVSLDPKGVRVETAETGVYGVGYPTDASYTSEIIDVGAAKPRFRRYSRQWELFSKREDAQAEFVELPGHPVNWGNVRWRGRLIGSGGDVRIQFRSGNSPDTHVYSRVSAPGETDTRGPDGQPLDGFTWATLKTGQISQRELQYNEIGADLGADGPLGWSYWSAPMRFEDGLIDDSLAEDQWTNFGVPLSLPSGTRYIQFRLLFESTTESAVIFDFLEFDYDSRLVSGGVLAEVFPARASLGAEVAFKYFVRPVFAEGEESQFNRIAIDVPDLGTRVDTLKFDGLSWDEIAASAAGDIAGSDPLRSVQPGRRVADNGRGVAGEFAQSVRMDPESGSPQLLLKIPHMGAADFGKGEFIEIVFRARLFRASTEFTSTVWNDSQEPSATIQQPTDAADAVDHVATDGVLVVVDEIGESDPVVTVTPNPFTPNRDGVNEEVSFDFDLFLLMSESAVTVDIHDLSGLRVRRLAPAPSTAGNVQLTWNGLDEKGDLVPPGLYFYRLTVGRDVGDHVHMGTLAVLY